MEKQTKEKNNQGSKPSLSNDFKDKLGERILIKMAGYVNIVLKSSHNHIKMISKLWANNFSEPPEI